MKISLRKIGKTPSDFELESEGIIFKGNLQYHSGNLILLKATLKGLLEVDCNLCAKEFQTPVDEEVEFFISEGIYKDEENNIIDVVETFNGEVDLDEVLISEIELIKSDYFTCEECQNSSSD